uniref:B3 domain-containing protein n=1 Tax=Kalanchoe fedtschenkoi TaxID=63787 RepID=A0A7N0TT39_KALFE
MALALTRDLSLVDFVGMDEEMNMPDADEGIDVFAFVSEFAASRLKEVESALKKREEREAEGRIKVRRRLLVRNLEIPNKKMTAEKKATSPNEEEEEEMSQPHHAGAESASSMRPQRRRKPTEHFDEIGNSSSSKRANAMGVASTSDLLALQVIDEEPDLRRKKEKKVDDGEKPKKKPRVAAAAAPADTGPDLPESFKESIQRLGGRNPVLVIQKRLFSTDVAKQQNRLSVPLSSLKNDFLEDGERALLDSRLPNGHCKALEPKILDATGEDRIISLRKWEMKKDNGSASTITYNLNKPWYEMVTANGWEAGHLVQLWAFRVEEELGLAIVKLEENFC